MGMVGRRKKQDGLPSRVYEKHGAYYYVDKDNKWHRLGKTKPEMLKALAILLDAPTTILAGIMDRYARDVLPTKAPKTQREQTKQLAKLRKVFGAVAPDDVTQGHVAQYLDSSKAKVQANREIALFSHVYRKAIRWGLATKNPCTGVERNKESGDDEYITNDQYRAVYAVAPRAIRLAMDLCFLTGQRQEDLLRMEWKDCTEQGLLVVQGKTGTKVLLTWTPTLRAVINAARTADTVSLTHIICTERGQPYNPSGFRTAWQRLWKHPDLATVQRFKFKNLRAKSGTDAASGEHLGHLDPRTFERHYRRKPKPVAPAR